MRGRRPGPQPVDAAELCGLGRDGQFDGRDPPPERDHLRGAARRERSHRRPVLDALGVGRRDQLERDRRGKQPRLGGQRLDRDPEVLEARVARLIGRGEPGRAAPTMRFRAA